MKRLIAAKHESASGTFETCRPGVTMSPSEGRPEAPFRGLFAEMNGLGPIGARPIRTGLFLGQPRPPKPLVFMRFIGSTEKNTKA